MRLFRRRRLVIGGAYSTDFRRGFLTTMLLWPGVMAFGLAFAVLAHAAGFSLLETQALSLLVFAGASQVTTVSLAAGGAAPLAIVLTALLLNLRHMLYGLSLVRRLRQTQPPRGILAYLLTDESFGLTTKAFLDGNGSDAFLFGSEISLFSSFNAATLAGSLLGSLLPNPQSIGLDFIFPLTFLALLVPLLRSWRHVLVALIAAAAAFAISRVGASGIAVVVAAVFAAGLGALLEQDPRGSSGNPESSEREMRL
jgi:4-azaleucine resistance transporter AzlC